MSQGCEQRKAAVGIINQVCEQKEVVADVILGRFEAIAHKAAYITEQLESKTERISVIPVEKEPVPDKADQYFPSYFYALHNCAEEIENSLKRIGKRINEMEI
jgi:hypothetical protein